MSMSKIISLFFWILLILLSIVSIIRSNSDYKSLSHIKCEAKWNIWDDENKVCKKKLVIDDIDKIEEKQIGTATKDYDISVFYKTFWITTLDGTIKKDLDRIVTDFKDIRMQTQTPGQLIMTNKYYKYKDEVHNFLSVVFEKRKIVSSWEEQISYITYLYDINTGNFLNINDVFINVGTPLGIIFPKIKNKLTQKYPWTNEDVIIAWSWKNIFENYKSFYIENKNINFIFPAGQVVDKNKGVQIIEIPLFEIENILSEKIK